jgi:hypothetical protein
MKLSLRNLNQDPPPALHQVTAFRVRSRELSRHGPEPLVNAPASTRSYSPPPPQLALTNSCRLALTCEAAWQLGRYASMTSKSHRPRSRAPPRPTPGQRQPRSRAAFTITSFDRDISHNGRARAPRQPSTSTVALTRCSHNRQLRHQSQWPRSRASPTLDTACDSRAHALLSQSQPSTSDVSRNGRAHAPRQPST